MVSQEVVNTRFAALADPTRRAILNRLVGGELCVSDLAEPFSLTQPTITSHLNYLERAGLIERRKVAQKHMCSLKTESLATLTDWLQELGREWSGRFDRLTEYADTKSKP